MTQELQAIFDKSLQSKWRARLPAESTLKWAIESEFVNQLADKNKDLLKCTQESMQQAMMSVATTGLSLNPQLQHLYLIPRNVFTGQGRDRKYSHTEAQLLVSYRGMMEVVNRSGHVRSVKAKVVYANEPFEYIEGTATEIRHKIIKEANKRGEIVGAYCVAKLEDGELMVEYMDKSQLDKAREASESKDSIYSPWKKWPEEMCKKTVTRRAWKYWPKSSGIDAVNEIMYENEGGIFADTGRHSSSEPVIVITEEQALELHAMVSDNLPDADAAKWVQRLAASMGETEIENLPASRFEEAKQALQKAINDRKGNNAAA